MSLLLCRGLYCGDGSSSGEMGDRGSVDAGDGGGGHTIGTGDDGADIMCDRKGEGAGGSNQEMIDNGARRRKGTLGDSGAASPFGGRLHGTKVIVVSSVYSSSTSENVTWVRSEKAGDMGDIIDAGDEGKDFRGTECLFDREEVGLDSDSAGDKGLS